MRHLKFLGFFLLLSTVGKGQNEKYKSLVKEFIEYIRIKNSATDTIVLGEYPLMNYLPICTWVYSDTNLIGTSEKEYIVSEIKYPLIKNWTSELVNKAKFISWERFTDILQDSTKRWPYFHKNYGPGLIYYSFPIFFRNNTMCLFYSEQLSGPSGSGSVILYRKEKDDWIIVKEFCGWHSG